jgi:hypothetical protein
LVNAKDIVRRLEQMEYERSNWEDTWQQISDHELGRRDFQTKHIIGGRQRLQNIYDGTGMRAHSTFVALVSSLLTNPASDWFLLTTADQRLLQNRRIALWIQEAQEHLRWAIRRGAAAFQPQMHEMYTDLIGFGTGAIAVLEDPLDGLYFHAHNLQEIFLEEDYRGRIDTVYRRVELTARQVEEKYPGKSQEAVKLIATKNENQKVKILQALFPNGEAHLGGIGNLPIASVHIAMGTGAPEVLREGGYHEMPIMATRWEKDSGEIYGRGPGVSALPDCKMSNQMNKTMLKAGQKAVDPPLMVSDRGVQSTIRTHSGGVTTVRDTGSNLDPIRPIDSKAKFNIGLELIKDRRSGIEGSFHVDLLEIFRQPNMTATHVLEIVEQADRALSPVLGRQQIELLEPLVNRAFMIELRSGRMPPPPEELIGHSVIAEYQSPVVRAQKSSERRALREGVAGALEFANTVPEILDNYDTDKVARLDWELGGLPVAAMRSLDDVAAIRETRAQKRAQDEQIQLELEAADVASKFQGGAAA